MGTAVSEYPMQLHGIIKLDVEMFHHESWKLVYLGVKRSKVKVAVRGS